MDALHSIEVSLCLQFLDAASLLRAARCSRRLLALVRSPFAWQGHARTPAPVQASVAHLVPGSMLERVPLCIRMRASDPQVVASELVPIAGLDSIQRLELQLHPSNITTAPEHELSTLSACSGSKIHGHFLRVAVTEQSEATIICRHICEALKGWRRLVALVVHSSHRLIAAPLCVCISALHLERLAISIASSALDHPWLTCHLLRVNTLAVTLKHLSLRRIHFAADPDAYPFSRMKSLTSLHFDECSRINPLIPDLGLLPSLARIDFTRQGVAEIWQLGPTPSMMTQLQDSCARLECVGIRFCSHDAPPRLPALRQTLSTSRLRINVDLRSHDQPPYE